QGVDGQLRSMESRARSLQEQLRSLEVKVDEKKYELDAPKKAAPPPAPTPAPKAYVPPKPPLAPWPHKHTVLAGDTLRSIAAQHYGDASLWELIYTANPEKIDRGLPREGEVLVVPAPGGGR
ncbi:MAG: LysM peptidoglycan-binding domain-containing protein, partial [Elusimicrobia bacterium]|nr:LysM peptidoglycan-binding domain-containing protein [Elusimicrobiota bacterium]